jgi:hypothetical protein
MADYHIHFGDAARLVLEIIETDGSRTRSTLSPGEAVLLANLGPRRQDLRAGLDQTVASGKEIELGSVIAEGPVRFFCRGRRISTSDGLEAVADGLVVVIARAVRDWKSGVFEVVALPAEEPYSESEPV